MNKGHEMCLGIPEELYTLLDNGGHWTLDEDERKFDNFLAL
jgi:hypothetical protein